MPFFRKSKKQDAPKTKMQIVEELENENGWPIIDNQVPAGKFHLFRSGLDYKWYFHLKSRNGKVILTSEGYMQKNMAIKSINRIKQIAPGATVVVDDLA